VPSPEITTASLSDVGRVRTRNEDYCEEFSHPAGHRLLVLADGMGGHQAGETASRTAVETIGAVFADFDHDPDAMLRGALEAANERVHQMAVDDPELRGMGTTVVALLLEAEGEAWVAHVGDSRLYRLRANVLEPLTQDHSVVAELERRGLLTPDEAAVHPRRNEILRSIGVQGEVEVDVARLDLQVGDRFVLCSDGLSGMVDDMEITTILADHIPQLAAQLLIDRANEHGGHDNVTVQIASVGCEDDAASAAAQAPAASADEGHGAEAGAAPHEGAHGAVSDRDRAELLALEKQVIRRRRQAVVVLAVLLAGVAALTLLWRIYSVTTSLPTEPLEPSHVAEPASATGPSKSPRAASIPANAKP